VTPSAEIRVLLVDDHQLVREGIRALLGKRAGITVVAEAENGIEALELIKTLQPDIVLSDIAIPGLNGLALTERVTAEAPNVRVIILSMHQSEAHVSQALSAGAAGYLVKGASIFELELAIKSVAAGGTYLTPSVAGKVVEGYIKSGANSSSSRQLLTPRQREILQLLVEGCNTKETAHRLNISVKTVESHRADLMERLDIHDVAGLVRYAIENHLV
jgi:DNA-binding NarL/FixJ family response regulator